MEASDRAGDAVGDRCSGRELAILAILACGSAGWDLGLKMGLGLELGGCGDNVEDDVFTGFLDGQDAGQ